MSIPEMMMKGMGPNLKKKKSGCDSDELYQSHNDHNERKHLCTI